MVGEQPVMSFDGVTDSGSVQTRLRDILSSSKSALGSTDSKAANIGDDTDITKDKSKKASRADKNADAMSKPLTMRQKVEAYYAEQNRP